jgi:hypothetical protein
MFNFDESSSFAVYKNEFDLLCSQMDEKLSKNEADISAEQTQAKLQYENMNLHSRELPAEERKEARKFLKECKSKLEQYERKALIGAGGDVSGHDKQKMADATDKARAGNDMLLQSIKTVQETEAVAGEIENQLADNRQQIEHIQGQVKQVDGELEGANSILKRMGARARHWWKS